MRPAKEHYSPAICDSLMAAGCSIQQVRDLDNGDAAVEVYGAYTGWLTVTARDQAVFESEFPGTGPHSHSALIDFGKRLLASQRHLQHGDYSGDYDPGTVFPRWNGHDE